MRILQICLRVPFPPNDGGTIAMNNMAQALKKAGATVKIIALNTNKHFVDPASLPESFVQDFSPEMVFLDASVNPVDAFFNLFSSSSYNISRFDIKLFHETLEKLLRDEEYDVIQLESIFVAPYLRTIRKFSRAKIILRAHNVEYLIWKRLASSERGFLRKNYLGMLAERLKVYETEMFNNFDGIIALTEEDCDLLHQSGCSVPVLVSPIGLNTDAYQAVTGEVDVTSIFHLGSMDWMPNIEGVDWFIKDVYPLLKTSHKEFKIYLAGKSMSDRLMKLNGQHFHISGRVDDAKGFMVGKQIMIVPLLSGGGMRVKIIEGMAMGKTIISTSIGAEGIQYTDGVNMIIADSAEAFSKAILNCLADPNFCKSIGQHAKKSATEFYDNRVIGLKVIEFFNKLHTYSSRELKAANKDLINNSK